MGDTCWEFANGKKIYDYEKIVASGGGGLPLLLGYIQVYEHNIQTSSLKPLSQSKPNFILNVVRKGV